MSMATVGLSVRVPPDVRELVQAAAQRANRSQSEVVSEALRNALGALGTLPPRDEMLAHAAEEGLAGAASMDDEELYDALCDVGLARAVAEDLANPTRGPRVPFDEMKRRLGL